MKFLNTIEKEVDRVVIITGGSRGIGEACAYKFASKGDVVIVNYLKDSNSAKIVEAEIEKLDGECVLYRADVSNSIEVKEMVEKVVSTYGKIDVLINNAGISDYISFSEITEKDWENVMKINLDSCFLCSKYVLPQMVNQKGGRVINISSLAGITGSIFNGAHYAVSKAGIISLTKCLAKQYAEYQILVNCVAPGIIQTDMIKSFNDSQNEMLLTNIPLKRFGTSDEVANVVAFLASEECSYITGATISVNGGIFM